MGTHYGRQAWTKTANAAVATKRKQVHLTWHYPGFGTDAVKTADWSLERCFQQLRAWRNMHVGSGKYREVAYNLYALPTGDVVDGRGNRQNGANGTSTANRAGMSVQVLIGDNEALTTGHLEAILLAMVILERWHPGITARQYPHSHWTQTRCPGPKVRGSIPFKLGPATSRPVPANGPAWRTSPRVAGMTAAEVEHVQRLVGVTVDGKYGDKTGTAVAAVQTELDLVPDGVWGPTTEAEVSKLDRIEQKLDALDRKVQAFGDQIHWRTDITLGRTTDLPEKLDALDKKLQAFGEQIHWRADVTMKNLPTLPDKVARAVNGDDVDGTAGGKTVDGKG